MEPFLGLPPKHLNLDKLAAVKCKRYRIGEKQHEQHEIYSNLYRH